MHSLWNTYALNPWFVDHVWWWSWKWLLGWHCNWWHFDKKWNMCFSNHLSDYANDRIHSVLSYVYFSLHRYMLNGHIFSKLLPSYNDDCMIHIHLNILIWFEHIAYMIVMKSIQHIFSHLRLLFQWTFQCFLICHCVKVHLYSYMYMYN